ncbi:hypothetical protein PCANC_14705 [Puccinia coronata f. sp. avenae]|uniref:Uncharacterized protein n=2 Tax=Puccinia coronata f. sp. avenae TaxID=200324 RepID=A0A2N5SXU3_9BASI|nr:hypothetical protein PCANC_14705 [Puccinia coronata f. sp. avenae]
MDNFTYAFGSNQNHLFHDPQQTYIEPFNHHNHQHEYMFHQGYTNNQGAPVPPQQHSQLPREHYQTFVPVPSKPTNHPHQAAPPPGNESQLGFPRDNTSHYLNVPQLAAPPALSIQPLLNPRAEPPGRESQLAIPCDGASHHLNIPQSAAPPALSIQPLLNPLLPLSNPQVQTSQREPVITTGGNSNLTDNTVDRLHTNSESAPAKTALDHPAASNKCPATPPPPIVPPQSSKGSDIFRLSAEDMAVYKKLPTHRLRALQSTHIKNRKLHEEVKLAAEDLYLEYHRKILLLSLEYSRPATSIARHLGQGCMRRENKWNDFRVNDKAAQAELHQTDLDLAERNQTVAAGYRQATNSTTTATAAPPLSNTFSDPLSNLFPDAFLKEISDAMQIKGFLVLASQDHTSKYFWQGGSIIAKQYLWALMDAGDPIGGFHSFAAGTKGRVLPPRNGSENAVPSAGPADSSENTCPSSAAASSETSGASLQDACPSGAAASSENACPSGAATASGPTASKSNRVTIRNAAAKTPRKPRQVPGAELYKDVNKGKAAENWAYLSEVLGRMFLNAGGNSSGWPGKNTDAGLAEYKLKLVIKKNNLGLDSILRNRPIRAMEIEECWRVSRGLKMKLIKLETIQEGSNDHDSENQGASQQGNQVGSASREANQVEEGAGENQ